MRHLAGRHHRRGASCVLRWLVPGLALCSSPVAGWGATIYVTSTAGGLPAYSDSPAGPNSQVHMHISAVPPRARAAGAWGPAALSELPAGGARLDADLRGIVRAAARLHVVPEALLLAVIHVESDFNPRARSPKGAIGLMQIMPATGARYGVSVDLDNPVNNIAVGARHLRDLLDIYKGNTELVLAAYNAGQGAVMRYRQTIPPFAETQAYVTKVLYRYARYARQT